jgi:WD40 repeat protein
MPALVTHGPEYLKRLGAEAKVGRSGGDHPRQVAFVPGRAMLAALCQNGRLRLIPLQGGKETSVSVATPATVLRTHLAVSPKGDLVLAGRFGVDPRTGKKLWTAKPKEWWASALTVAVTPDGRSAIAGGRYCLNPATGKQTGYLLDTVAQHTGGVTACAISRDGKTLATGDGSGNVVLTSLASRHGSVLAGGNQDDDSATQGFFRSIEALAFGRDRLAVGGEGTEVRLLSPRDLSLVRSLPLTERRAPRVPSSPETRGLAFAPDGVTLVAATVAADRRTAHVQVWNAETGKERMRVTVDHRLMSPGGLRSLALSEDGSTIALALSTGTYVCDMPRR